MPARDTLKKMIVNTLGMFSFLMEGLTRRNEQETGAVGGHHRRSSRSKESGLERVTDPTGEEYLCPLGAIHDQNFVSEREKRNCFEYDLISRHPTE